MYDFIERRLSASSYLLIFHVVWIKILGGKNELQ